MKVGIVIPTLGTRSEYLQESIRSIRAAGQAHICLVVPIESDVDALLNGEEVDQIVADPMLGLAAAIDLGLKSLPSEIEFVNWLGDDDLLTEGSLDHTLAILISNPNVALVYGECEYINGDGKQLWTNKSGSYAKFLLRFGPQLIPQPGSLMRRDMYERIGGLDYQFKWAFDLDLLIRLSRVGRLQFTPRTLAKFRWHDGSLTVGGRKGSVAEASRIRVNSLPLPIRLFASLWEVPIRGVILWAGARLTLRSKSL